MFCSILANLYRAPTNREPMLRALVAPLAIALLLLAPSALAEVREFALSQPMEKPVALALDREGDLWVTLDGAWAVAEVKPFGGSPRMWPLAEPPVDEHDSLYGIVIGHDGTVWTASRTHLHRVAPHEPAATAIPLPNATQIAGGLHASPAAIYVGLPTENGIVSHQLGLSRTVQFAMPRDELGPLEFAEAPNGTVYFTATYGNTYAWIAMDGSVQVGPANLVQAPTGITFDAHGTMWLGEHGGSAIVAVEPETGAATRYPTAPSPYYPISGPSGIAAAPDGSVWAVLHFSDRVARLDRANRTMVEYELPSAPVTNAQHLVLADDGAVWVAEREKHKLARVTYGGETPAFDLPARIDVRQGEQARGNLTGRAVSLVTNTGVAGLNASIEDGALVVDAHDVAPGEYLVLVSDRVDAKTWVGRYVTVAVAQGERGESPTPGPAPIALLAVVGLAALALRRWRAA